MERGFRIIPTFFCSARCHFCYQAHLRENKLVLPLEKLDFILQNIDLSRYDYCTFMGGEVTEIPNFNEYVTLVRKQFPKRINVTTNGNDSLEIYDSLIKSGVNHITISSICNNLDSLVCFLKPKVSVRVNMYFSKMMSNAELKRMREIYCFAMMSDIQLNFLYDYRVSILDDKEYSSAIRDIIGIAQFIDHNLERAYTGSNYLIMTNKDGQQVWFDINYKKVQELVISPYGTIVRGFEYMDEFKK